MTDRKFYRRVIQFEILSEEPIDDCLSLSQIDYETIEGRFSGAFLDDAVNEEVDGEAMAKLLVAQGSDPEFFRLSEDGEPLEEDE
jgi:hypothetical protein